MSFIFVIILLANLGVSIVICQIDLGSFSLGQNKYGDLKFIFNQAANILGFGGDRGFDLTLGEGRFNAKARQGALISGERVGVDSDVGINEFEGVNLRNFLSFGSSPISFNNPAGQFVSFLEGIKKFFTTTITNKPPDTMWSSPQYENPSVKTGTVFHAFEEPEKQKISGETMNYGQPENDDYDNYYHNVGVGNEATQGRGFKTTGESSFLENWAMLNRSITGTEFNTTSI